ncbi:hypothetical protein M1446_01535 [Candidatus Dependentiae bacterium]|nr:hypothetical protein [Candidatus Dependentiae bacterium]
MNTSLGFFGRLKHTLKETFTEYSRDFSAEKALLYAAYCFVAFIAGFIFKNYGKYIFLLVLSVAAAFWATHYFNLITIKYDYARQIFGMEHVQSIQDLFYLIIEQIKSNLILSIMCVISFVIGWKVG